MLLPYQSCFRIHIVFVIKIVIQFFCLLNSNYLLKNTVFTLIKHELIFLLFSMYLMSGLYLFTKTFYKQVFQKVRSVSYLKMDLKYFLKTSKIFQELLF